MQDLHLPSEAQAESPATKRDSEEATGQDLVEIHGESVSTSAAGPLPGGEADTREAAYARMQALLAERNGLPPPQPPVAAPASQPFAAGVFWLVAAQILAQA